MDEIIVKKHIIIILALLLVSLQFIFPNEIEARRYKLEEPELPLPCQMSTKKVQRAIESAFHYYRWSTKIQTDGSVVVQIYVRRHMLSYRVVIDNQKLKIYYHDSNNMNYQEINGVRYLHGKATNWVYNVLTVLRPRLWAQCDNQ